MLTSKVLWFPDGKATGEEYSGERTADAMAEFLRRRATKQPVHLKGDDKGEL